MNILVTGGSGFLGCNMVKKLSNFENNKIYIVDNLSTGKKENIESFLNEKVHFIEMDICDPNIITLIKELKIEEIYNFACPASPKYYLEHPIETMMASVVGVKNLLDSIVNTKIKFFHSSTSEVYGNALISPQNEEYWGNVNPIGVRACYDEGKRTAECLIYDYIRKYNVDVRVARLFNTYGPGMCLDDGRVISNFIVQALQDKDITVHGDGRQTRSFCYVDDTIEGIYRLMNLKIMPLTPINIGNPDEQNVIDVANYIKNKLNSNSSIIYCNKMSDDPQKRKPNISKANSLLKWKPILNFDDGIMYTIVYFKNKIFK